jgi:flagellar biosynthesis/type III secretory pathway M-ring protein FliF/YscJ
MPLTDLADSRRDLAPMSQIIERMKQTGADARAASEGGHGNIPAKATTTARLALADAGGLAHP